MSDAIGSATSTAIGGLGSAEQRFAKDASKIATSNGGADVQTFADLATAKTSFTANIQVLRVADENTKRLLDIFS